MLKAININSTVLVKLTNRGRDIYYDNFKKTLGYYPTLKEDEHGYSKWQLWNLMQEFGEHISIGFANCFETTILIEEKEIEDRPLMNKEIGRPSHNTGMAAEAAQICPQCGGECEEILKGVRCTKCNVYYGESAGKLRHT